MRIVLAILSMVTLGVLGGIPTSFADTLIKDARIIDGTGKPAFLGSVRISGERIVSIGDLIPTSGDTIFDAKGLTLSPGFIDTHSHHDWGLSENRDALAVITQGITTSIFGQDGEHDFPLQSSLDVFRERPVSMNIASYVGHNTLRNTVMGEGAKREATGDEISAMKTILRAEMAAGAIGLSTGLEYEPGIYSSSAEVIELAQLTANLGGRYISHIRSEDRFFWPAINEIINIGRQTGMPVQISHIKLAIKEIWGQTAKLLNILNQARAEGVNITADIYPYEYWESTLWVLLPERDADDLNEIQNVLDNITPSDGIVFMIYGPDPSYVGKTLADISVLRGLSDAETFSELLKESDIWQEEHQSQGQSVMGKSMLSQDIGELMKWEHTNICTDGGFEGHPRGYGAFPRFLSYFVNRMDLMSLEEGIRRMTSLAAHNMGLKDRGEIKVDAYADLVLFNEETIKDNASIENPSAISKGIEMVWVNGQLALNQGQATHYYSGKVIK